MSVIRAVEMIMGANGLLDGSTKVPKNQRKSEFPYEICINDSEIKTKGKLCLFGEWGAGLVEIGCITTPYCYSLFLYSHQLLMKVRGSFDQQEEVHEG